MLYNYIYMCMALWYVSFISIYMRMYWLVSHGYDWLFKYKLCIIMTQTSHKVIHISPFQVTG